MITGSFSASHDGCASVVPERIRRVTDIESIVFHRVTHGSFNGGYYLNPLLPYAGADLYHYDPSKDMVVMLSGTIYNRDELSVRFNFASPVTDPELIAVMFITEGPGFVRRLNGDFAIFIGQLSKRQAYLFRDQVGIRPLAYAIEKQTLCFSSDITGLCRALSDSQPVDRDYLLSYFKYTDHRKTPVDRVKKLLPGHFLHFSEKGVGITKYWDPEKIKNDKELTHAQMMSDLKALVWDSVKIRCDSRFTAGSHVSGGIDSGLVSALARKEYPQQNDFYGFSWSPAVYEPHDVRYDEREIVVTSCEKTGITPVFSGMNAIDFQRIVSDYYNNQGYFCEDKTAEQAVAAGVNLLFSGWGGDEFISTGNRGIELDLLLGLHWGTFFRRNPLTRPRQFARTMFHYVLFPALCILDRSTARSFRDDARYIKKGFKKSDPEALRDFYFHTSRRQLHLRLLHFYHLQERCESWAINGYLKGVEYRYPLLDKRIIEYMLKVPSTLLCETDLFRPVLREISQGILPDEVRLGWRKNDPVCWEYIDELFKESATSFMNEADEWQTNEELYFVDFELLKKDIERYKETPEAVDKKVLFRAIVYLKGLFEFLRVFRNPGTNQNDNQI